MNIKSKQFILILLLLLSLSFAVPVLAHDDPEEDETTAEVSDDHAEEGDGHSESEDNHTDEPDAGHNDEADSHGGGYSNTGYVIGGIIGAVLLAAGAAFLFSPRPSLIILIGLALIGATGVVHLMIGSAWGDTLLLLNGIGYLGLGVMWAMPNQMIPNQRRILAIILAVYTLITIAGYFVTHDHYDFVALFTKAIEVLLLIVLVISEYGSTGES